MNEDKIEIGEYVRTEKGIIGILKEQFTYGNGVNYPEPQEWVLDANGNEYIANEANYEDIVKHSKNIIDLIEVGDYVNGHLIVNEIYGEDDNELYFEIEGGFNKAKYIGEKDIKSILTKEQFKSLEYKVKED